MSIGKPSRARGSSRGGCGGGYEPLDPDFDIKRMQRMRTEYDSLDDHWKHEYLNTLSKSDQYHITHREEN